MIDTLEKLGTPKNYMKLHISVKRLIIGWIMSVFFVNMIDSLWLIGRSPKSYAIIAIYQTFVLNHMSHLNMLYDLTFMMLLRYILITSNHAHIIYTKLLIIQINYSILYFEYRYIEFQFKHINQHIQELMEEKEQRVKHIWATTGRSSSFLTHQDMSNTETIKQLVWILM